MDPRWPRKIVYKWQPHIDQITPEMKANKITKEQGHIEVRTVENHTTINKQKPIRTQIPQITPKHGNYDNKK